MQKGKVLDLVGMWTDREKDAGRIPRSTSIPDYDLSKARRCLQDKPRSSQPTSTDPLPDIVSRSGYIQPVLPLSQPVAIDEERLPQGKSNQRCGKRALSSRLPIASKPPISQHGKAKSRISTQAAAHSLDLSPDTRPRYPTNPSGIKHAVNSPRPRRLSPEIIQRRANRPMIKRACDHYEPIATIMVPPTVDSLRMLGRMPRGEYMLARLESDMPEFIAADTYASHGQLPVVCAACRRMEREGFGPGGVTDEQYVLMIQGRSRELYTSVESERTDVVERQSGPTEIFDNSLLPEQKRMRIRGGNRCQRRHEPSAFCGPALMPLPEQQRWSASVRALSGKQNEQTPVSNLEESSSVITGRHARYDDIHPDHDDYTKQSTTQILSTDDIIEQLEWILAEHTKTITSIFGDLHHARAQSQEALNLSIRLSPFQSLHRPGVTLTAPSANTHLETHILPVRKSEPDTIASSPHLDDPPSVLRQRTASVSGIMSLLDNSAAAVGAQMLPKVASQQQRQQQDAPRGLEIWSQLIDQPVLANSPVCASSSSCSSWASTTVNPRSAEARASRELPGSFVESDQTGAEEPGLLSLRGRRPAHEGNKSTSVTKPVRRQRTAQSSLNSEYFPPLVSRKVPLSEEPGPSATPPTLSSPSEPRPLTQQPTLLLPKNKQAAPLRGPEHLQLPPTHPVSSRIRKLADLYSDSIYSLPFSDVGSPLTPNYLQHDPARRPLAARGKGAGCSRA